MEKDVTCPVDYDYMDSRLVKLYAAWNLIILILITFFSIGWLTWILVTDFLLRMLFGIKAGILCYPLLYLLRLFRIKEKPVNAAPKKFAVKVGFVFTFLMWTFYFFHMNPALKITGIIFLLAVASELFFNFCLACRFYGFFIRKKDPDNKGIFKH
jgi:hypothetical protein